MRQVADGACSPRAARGTVHMPPPASRIDQSEALRKWHEVAAAPPLKPELPVSGAICVIGSPGGLFAPSNFEIPKTDECQLQTRTGVVKQLQNTIYCH